MRFKEAEQGRVFIIRLEDGDVVHECIEAFAKEQNITAAALVCLGGADTGSRLITGPVNGRSETIRPHEIILNGVHEVSGTGTIFPDTEGVPVLHMHLSCGREQATRTGCIRRGVRVWHVMEIILFEMINSGSCRIKDPATGFELLSP
ncbi:DNA-binding protein [bacterium]|nr:DNA-binding protein [bacterium]